jgi:hypothetical protein
LAGDRGAPPSGAPRAASFLVFHKILKRERGAWGAVLRITPGDVYSDYERKGRRAEETVGCRRL